MNFHLFCYLEFLLLLLPLPCRCCCCYSIFWILIGPTEDFWPAHCKLVKKTFHSRRRYENWKEKCRNIFQIKNPCWDVWRETQISKKKCSERFRIIFREKLNLNTNLLLLVKALKVIRNTFCANIILRSRSYSRLALKQIMTWLFNCTLSTAIRTLLTKSELLNFFLLKFTLIFDFYFRFTFKTFGIQPRDFIKPSRDVLNDFLKIFLLLFSSEISFFF